MSDVVIRAEGLGKRYLIGHEQERERYVALRDVIARAAHNLARSAGDMMRGRQLIAGDEIEEFWALRDVDFEIRRGEVVGIIGRNGAGKSTLLKILSRITEPTTGRVEIRGRVASLLEIGTGFHPELTGRENIYLNGAILGMTRAEIRRKFDEIVAFAGVEKFLDTPVKRYSSGMYVRLAFAVAAHLEPEILIVDEVLAVGDAEFQKKCLGKMKDVAGGGRTVLFVSHNISSVADLCSRGLHLNSGTIVRSGAIPDVIRSYRTKPGRISIGPTRLAGPIQSVSFSSVSINGSLASEHVHVPADADIRICVSGSAAAPLPGARLAVGLRNHFGRLVTIHDEIEDLRAGDFEAEFVVPRFLLRPGEYSISVGGSRQGGISWFWLDNAGGFDVTPVWCAEYDRQNDGIINIRQPGRRVQGMEGRLARKQ